MVSCIECIQHMYSTYGACVYTALVHAAIESNYTCRLESVLIGKVWTLKACLHVPSIERLL